MNATIFVPVTILSLINHQEARFLIPITLPIVLLHSSKLITGFTVSYPFQQENAIYRFVYQHLLCTKASADRLFKCWVIVNIALSIFFGFIHQGGVIQLTQYLSENVVNYRTQLQFESNRNIYLITSHLYNIPTSLLLQPSSKTLLVNPDNGQKYSRKKQFFLHEYGGLDIDKLQQKIKLILDMNEMRLHQEKKHYKLFLAIPTSLTEELDLAVFRSNCTTIRYERIKTFYPHLSTEAFPNIISMLFNSDHIYDMHDNQQHNNLQPYSLSTFFKYFSKYIQQFGLAFYRVDVHHKNAFFELNN